jgi:hypothetical protein
MIRTYRRPAESTDIQAATEGKGSLSRNLLTLILPAGVVLFAVPYLVFDSFLSGAIISTLFVGGSTWSNVRFFSKTGARARSTAGAIVEVIEVDATRVFEIEHQGSHGPAYCFFSSDGDALLLIGQWQMGVKRFPSLSFRVMRWVDDGSPIRIEVTGRKVKPELSTVSLQGHYSNGDIEILKAQPDTLQQDLDRAFGRGAA